DAEMPVRPYVGFVAFTMSVHVTAESIDCCHCTVGAGVPAAAAVNVTLAPALASTDCGCCVIAGVPSQGSTAGAALARIPSPAAPAGLDATAGDATSGGSDTLHQRCAPSLA